jgi:hypothetical protein
LTDKEDVLAAAAAAAPVAPSWGRQAGVQPAVGVAVKPVTDDAVKPVTTLRRSLLAAKRSRQAAVAAKRNQQQPQQQQQEEEKEDVEEQQDESPAPSPVDPVAALSSPDGHPVNAAVKLPSPARSVWHRPKILLLGDSITELSFKAGGWGAMMAAHWSRRVSERVLSRG